jgi:serine palmitoyltransferase
MSSAASYLAAVKQADLRARQRSPTPVPTATPALSLSSTLTTSTEDSVLRDGLPLHDDNEDGLGFPLTPPTSEQTFSTLHTEFGHCANETYRHTSAHPEGKPVKGHVDLDPPYYILLSTYVSYIILIIVGHIRDFFGKRSKSAEYMHLMPHNVRSRRYN